MVAEISGGCYCSRTRTPHTPHLICSGRALRQLPQEVWAQVDGGLVVVVDGGGWWAVGGGGYGRI